MKKHLLTVSMLFAVLFLNAQNNQVFTFDELLIPDTGFWDGSDTTNYVNYFGDDILTFGNNYNQDYFSWDGFAFSKWTDSTTAGYMNQWSSFAGHAASDSVFGLVFVPTDWMSANYNTIPVEVNFSSAILIDSVKLTNSTYAGKEIRDGGYNPAFSDDDFYFVRIIGYNEGLKTDSVDFYLADYTNGQSLVVQEWQNVDLSALDTVTSITFNVFSSDVGDWGINTPAYFCLDDIAYTTLPTNLQQITSQSINIYPNPTADYISFSENIQDVSVYDLFGRNVLKFSSITNNEKIDVSNLTSGTYFVKAKVNNQIITSKFIKM